MAYSEEEFAHDIGTLDSRSFNPYDILVFRQRPVLRYGDSVAFPLCRRFLLDRCTDGVFWIVSDQCRQSDRFRIFWGAVVEEYAWKLFDSLPLDPPLLRIFRGHKYRGTTGTQTEASDLMLLYEDTLVLVEVSTGRFRRMTKEVGSTYEDDLSRVVLEGGILQLYRVSRDYRDGQLILEGPRASRIKSVLVKYESFPWNATVAAYVRKKAVQQGHCDAVFANECVIIDMEELESVAALMARGVSLVALLDEWQASSCRDQPLKNFLLNRYPSFEKTPAVVREGFKRMAAIMKRRLGMTGPTANDLSAASSVDSQPVGE